jgi:meso-butanediol dehydrogenase / (S,S)-butanediol dehydrogenase / diacetyl reductase
VNIEGDRAIVTGGAQGIGEATARLLAQLGVRVLVADINHPGAEAVAREIVAAGGEAIPCQVDVTSSASCAAMVDAAVTAWGGVDILVNCAGVLERLSVPETSEEAWDRVMAVNVKGTFLPCKFAVPLMERQGRGSIVNLASGAALVGNPNLAAYGASKGAVLLLTKCMAADHAASGVRVNCVCPGNIDTEMNRAVFRASPNPEQARQAAALAAPLGRLGTAEEVAAQIAFLCSDACAFMTGAAIVLDGGLTLPGSRQA